MVLGVVHTHGLSFGFLSSWDEDPRQRDQERYALYDLPREA